MYESRKAHFSRMQMRELYSKRRGFPGIDIGHGRHVQRRQILSWNSLCLQRVKRLRSERQNDNGCRCCSLNWSILAFVCYYFQSCHLRYQFASPSALFRALCWCKVPYVQEGSISVYLHCNRIEAIDLPE